MASISTDPNGNRQIQFMGADQKRRTVRLGKVSRKAAETICRKVEDLNTAIMLRQAPEDDTARWVGSLNSTLHDKLSAVGLVRKRGSMMLGPYLDSYLAMRGDVKGSAATVYGHTRRCLIEFFGADKPLREITPGDADEWRIWLGEHKETRDGKTVKVTLADNTVARRCGIAKQFFRAARRKGLVLQNPFADMKAGLKRQHGPRLLRQSRGSGQGARCLPGRRMAAAVRPEPLRRPTLPVRALGATLGRRGLGPRNRITVQPQDRTPRGQGDPRHTDLPRAAAVPGSRLRCRPPERAEYVITRYRDANANLRTQLERIIRKAGLKPWPKLFQNLRAPGRRNWPKPSRCTSSATGSATAQAIAAKHYLQVTDEHFEQAARKRCKIRRSTMAETSRQSSRMPETANPQFPEDVRHCLHDRTPVSVGDEGLEPPTSTV